MAEKPSFIPAWLWRLIAGEETSAVPPTREPAEPGRLLGRLPDAGRLRGPQEDAEARERAGIVLPDPLPEPDDIDRVSREDNAAMREHFRAERDAERRRTGA